MNDEIENKVAEIVNRHFPGYKFSLMGDPEDETVQLIRLYDVADEDLREFKDRLWDVIEEHLEVEGVSFIPSVVSHTNTAEFYSDRLRVRWKSVQSFSSPQSRWVPVACRNRRSVPIFS